MAIGWQKLLEREDVADEAEPWSVFHENSKTSRFEKPLTNDEVVGRMGQLWETLPYDERDRVDLPRPGTPLDAPLGETMLRRQSARTITPCPLQLDQVASLLHHAYGITRDNQNTTFPRPFRAVPSGGALYPLELFVHTAYVQGLPTGLYHFNPQDHSLRSMQRGDSSRQIGQALVQANLAVETSMLIFLTAVFERSTFKYGNRGYRFILLEAGHVAQNVNLAATAMNLACINIGGFFDRDIDRFLGLDGVNHSTVYMIGIGREAGVADHG